MIRPVEVCQVCRFNRTLKVLKEAIAELQSELRVEWKGARIVQLDEHIIEEGNFDWFILNRRGTPTVIPSYNGYSSLWEKAIIVNPLEVDWILFDVHDQWDIEYLHSIVPILNDQRDLWENDSDTTEASIMKMFAKFIRSLTRLMVFSNNITYAI